MTAARKIEISLQDLLDSVDPKWRSKISICDLNGSPHPDCDGAKGSICVTLNEDPENVLESAVVQKLSNICQVQNESLEDELNTAAKMLVSPREFVENPLGSILLPKESALASEQKIDKLSIDFFKASQKRNALQDLKQYLEKYTSSASLINELTSAADELFTNAIFNAPFSDESSVNPGKDRTDTSTQMIDGNSAELFAGVHSDRIVIGCKDPYGSLNLQSLLSRILKCYKDGVGKSINMGPGGAGIGSYLVFNTGTSYYVGILKGEATVVCFSVPQKMSSRKRGQVPKNLHFFEIKQEGS